MWFTKDKSKTFCVLEKKEVGERYLHTNTQKSGLTELNPYKINIRQRDEKGHDIVIETFNPPERHMPNDMFKMYKNKIHITSRKTDHRTILFVNINAKILDKILAVQI